MAVAERGAAEHPTSETGSEFDGESRPSESTCVPLAGDAPFGKVMAGTGEFTSAAPSGVGQNGGKVRPAQITLDVVDTLAPAWSAPSVAY